jgi:hypothetical protein
MSKRRSGSPRQEDHLNTAALAATFGVINLAATLVALVFYRIQGEVHAVMLVPYLLSSAAYRPVYRVLSKLFP